MMTSQYDNYDVSQCHNLSLYYAIAILFIIVTVVRLHILQFQEHHALNADKNIYHGHELSICSNELRFILSF